MSDSFRINDRWHIYELAYAPGYEDQEDPRYGERHLDPKQGAAYRDMLRRALQNPANRATVRQLLARIGVGEHRSDPDNVVETLVRLITVGRLRVRMHKTRLRPRLGPPVATQTIVSESSPAEAATTWVEIKLIDGEDEPIPDEAYKIRFSDGTEAEGRLDADGFARHDDIPSGMNYVWFPNIDMGDWRPEGDEVDDTERLALEIVDEDGNPIDLGNFELELPSGELESGELEGKILEYRDIEAGTATLTLNEVDLQPSATTDA